MKESTLPFLIFLQFVGPSIGHHSSYTFYKAVRYQRRGHEGPRILALGEFFFVKVWPKSDVIAVGEVQLLWEDKNNQEILSSVRLYFLPEYTPDGRLPFHGEVRTRIELCMQWLQVSCLFLPLKV